MRGVCACFRSNPSETGQHTGDEEDAHHSTGDDSDTEKDQDYLRKKPEMVIKRSIDAFSQKTKNIDTLFKNNLDLIDARVKILEGYARSKGSASLGPNGEDGDVESIEDIYFAKSISTYPMNVKTNITMVKIVDGEKQEVVSMERLGDPICDCFGFEIVDSSEGICLASIADGCNWGQKPFDAARVACGTFHEVTKKKLHKCTDIKSVAGVLVKAFRKAHTQILQSIVKKGINDVWEAGTTTLLGGVLLELDDKDAKRVGHSWAFICTSVGDCKAYHCHAQDGMITDVTVRTRPPSSITNVNDPGGRLGPYGVTDASADLRNLSIFIIPCDKDDIIFLVTDGLYDNFDPQLLDIKPSVLKLKASSWEEVDTDEAETAKDRYRNNMMTQKLQEVLKVGKKQELNNSQGKGKEKKKENKGKDEEASSSNASDAAAEGQSILNTASLQEMIEHLLDHAHTTTEYSRKWMQEHPTARMPDIRSKKRDPNMLGKMDHTTCVAFRVGRSASK